MAIPADKVRPLVQESSVTGGNPAEEQAYPLPLDPNEDAIEAQGVFYQPPSPSTTRDETTYHTRDDEDNLIAKDSHLTEEVRLVDKVFARRLQDRDVTIPSGFTMIRRDLDIASGVTINIEPGAELLLL